MARYLTTLWETRKTLGLTDNRLMALPIAYACAGVRLDENEHSDFWKSPWRDLMNRAYEFVQQGHYPITDCTVVGNNYEYVIDENYHCRRWVGFAYTVLVTRGRDRLLMTEYPDHPTNRTDGESMVVWKLEVKATSKQSADELKVLLALTI